MKLVFLDYLELLPQDLKALDGLGGLYFRAIAQLGAEMIKVIEAYLQETPINVVQWREPQ